MKCNQNEKRIAVLFLSVCIFCFFFVFAFLYLQKGSPRLEFAKTQLEIYTIKKKNALLQLIENVLNKSRSKYVH